MKAISLIPLALLLLAGVSLNAQEVPKEAKPATPPAAPTDPFLKEKEKKTELGEAGPTTYANVGVVVQYIDVKRERWQQWLATNDAQLDASPLRKEVETWIAAGDAKLAESSLVMSKSGQRSTVESVKFQYYPTNFTDAVGDQAFADAYDRRNVGVTIDIDPILTRDGAVELNFAPERVRYSGENPPQMEPGVDPGDVRFPVFECQKSYPQLTIDPQEWGLVGCERSLENGESHQTLIFLHPITHRFTEPSENATSPKEGVLTFTWLEVDHDVFNQSLLNEIDFSAWVGGGLYDGMKKAGAQINEERVLRFKDGQRSKIESIKEIIFHQEFSLPSEAGRLSVPQLAETKNVGVTVEVDTVFSDLGGVLNANLAAEFSSYFGKDVLHRVLINGEWKPNITTPRFYTMQPTTSLSLPLNTPVLVAVMSPPDDKGWTDPSRKVLLFVKFSR